MSKIRVEDVLFRDASTPTKAIRSQVITKAGMEDLQRSCSVGKALDARLAKYQFLTHRKMATDMLPATPDYYDIEQSTTFKNQVRSAIIGEKISGHDFHVPSPSRYNVSRPTSAQAHTFPKAVKYEPKRDCTDPEPTQIASNSGKVLRQTFPTALSGSIKSTPGPADYEINRSHYHPRSISSSRSSIPKCLNFMADLAQSGENFATQEHQVNGRTIPRSDDRFKQRPLLCKEQYDVAKFYDYIKPKSGCKMTCARENRQISSSEVRELNKAKARQKKQLYELQSLNQLLKYQKITEANYIPKQ